MPDPDPLELLTGGLFSGSGLAAVTSGLLTGSTKHPRREIRDHVVELLRAAAIDGTADRVYESRAASLSEKLPALVVYTRDESAEILEDSPRRLQRTLELVVLVVAGGADVEDALDATSWVVEVLISSDWTLGGLAADVVFVSTEREFEEDGRLKLGSARLVFQVTHQTTVEEFPHEDLLKFGVKWDAAQPDGQIEAEDELDLGEEIP